MTAKDITNIKTLFYFHNYPQSSIARLFGLSRQRIHTILREESVTFQTGDECLLCGTEDSPPYYIDGNATNNNPGNKIVLCEGDKRRIVHMQLRRRRTQRVIIPERQSDL